MTFHFRPAKRVNTPLIVGLAGPTKSGKTFSAHRLARGLAAGGTVAMINAEGAKGHQYADEFDYVATDIEAPFRPERYIEALKAALEIKPAVVIVDSMSHMHDGPGGMLEYHEDELQRLAGDKTGRDRDRYNWTAWIKPKAAENEFIYTMLGADCHIVACFRAKEKIKVIPGKQPIDLGWQPIAGERVAFETIFTLLLPPHSKGVPDLSISEMRKPFDSLIPGDRPLDEQVGAALREWAAGASTPPPPPPAQEPKRTAAKPKPEADDSDDQIHALTEQLLAAATDDNRAAVESAIARNRASHWNEPGKHLAWLQAQAERVPA